MCQWCLNDFRDSAPQRAKCCCPRVWSVKKLSHVCSGTYHTLWCQFDSVVGFGQGIFLFHRRHSVWMSSQKQKHWKYWTRSGVGLFFLLQKFRNYLYWVFFFILHICSSLPHHAGMTLFWDFGLKKKNKIRTGYLWNSTFSQLSVKSDKEHSETVYRWALSLPYISLNCVNSSSTRSSSCDDSYHTTPIVHAPCFSFFIWSHHPSHQYDHHHRVRSHTRSCHAVKLNETYVTVRRLQLQPECVGVLKPIPRFHIMLLITCVWVCVPSRVKPVVITWYWWAEVCYGGVFEKKGLF